MPTAIPVALIGAGKHGARYLRHVLEDVPELRIAVLSRRDASAGRAQATQAGARFVADFRDAAVDPEVAAVIAVVPPHLHGEIAALATGAGKGLLLEKPVAPDVRTGLEILQMVEASGVPACVGHTLRYNRVVERVREWVGKIGPVRQVCLSQRFEPSRLAWLDDPDRAGGGIILHTGVHSFDLLRHFTGRDANEVFATTAAVATARTEDNFVAALAFEGAALTASVAGSRSTPGRSGAIEISGDRGQIVADHHHGTAVAITAEGRLDLTPDPPAATVRELLRGFAACLDRGESGPIPIADGVRAVALAEACYRSIASRRPALVPRLP